MLGQNSQFTAAQIKASIHCISLSHSCYGLHGECTINTMYYALCAMLFAFCTLHFALWTLQYALLVVTQLLHVLLLLGVVGQLDAMS